MLKAFLKAFNIEETQEAHVSWKDIEAQETWEAQRHKRPEVPKRTKTHGQTIYEMLSQQGANHNWAFKYNVSPRRPRAKRPRGPEAQRPRGPESNRPRERPIDQKLCTFFSQYLEEKNKIVLMMHINNIFFPLTIYRKRSPRMELTVGCQNYWQKEGYFTRLLTRVFFIEWSTLSTSNKNSYVKHPFIIATWRNTTTTALLTNIELNW